MIADYHKRSYTKKGSRFKTVCTSVSNYILNSTFCTALQRGKKVTSGINVEKNRFVTGEIRSGRTEGERKPRAWGTMSLEVGWVREHCENLEEEGRDDGFEI